MVANGLQAFSTDDVRVERNKMIGIVTCALSDWARDDGGSEARGL